MAPVGVLGVADRDFLLDLPVAQQAHAVDLDGTIVGEPQTEVESVGVVIESVGRGRALPALAVLRASAAARRGHV